MAIAGWLRFGCTNGLIIGTASMQLRQQHRQQLEVGEIGRLVGEAIESTGSDKAMDAGCLGLLPPPTQRERQGTIDSLYHARSGSDSHTALGFSTVESISPPQAILDYCSALTDFHTVSRASGPS